MRACRGAAAHRPFFRGETHRRLTIGSPYRSIGRNDWIGSWRGAILDGDHMDAADLANTTLAIAAHFDNRPNALIEILHRLQHAVGYVPEAAVQTLADALNLSRAEVHGVVTFYHDFKRQPQGRHVLKVCRAEACQSMGGAALVTHIEQRLGIACGQTTADGRVSVEAVYCLGLCATSPSAMLDGRVYGRLTPARADVLLQQVAE
jgi:formate dehydrogenase subunit gamma